MLYRSQKAVEILDFLLVYGRIRSRITKVTDPGGPKTYGSGSGTLLPTDILHKKRESMLNTADRVSRPVPDPLKFNCSCIVSISNSR
jgi:hypothetical protein